MAYFLWVVLDLCPLETTVVMSVIKLSNQQKLSNHVKCSQNIIGYDTHKAVHA